MELRISGMSFGRAKTKKEISSYNMHTHQFYELYYLISGQRKYFMGHTIYDVAPGNVVLIPRGVLHRTVSLGTKGFDRYIINFSQEHCDAFAAMAGRNLLASYPEGFCIQLSPDKAHQIQKSFEQVGYEMERNDEWTQVACTTLFHGILLDCLRYGKPKAPYQEGTADKIQQAAKYISEHYAECLTLEDIAGYVYMEKTYFSKRFKMLTGLGFLEYLTQTRLRVAEDFLIHTDLSIGDISDACGFSGSNYFGDVFRRYHGVSPTEYRLNAKKARWTK